MSNNLLIKFLTIISLSIFSQTISFANTCPKCHGQGRIKTQAGIATYGLDSRKYPCPICGKMISSGSTHYDQCDQCGGSGSIEGGRHSSSQSGGGSGDFDADLLIYLTPDEYNALQEFIRAMSGRTEYIECGTCNGTGKCRQCGGFFNTDTEDPNRCLLCGGTGFCYVCNGSRYTGTRVVKPTEEESKQIAKNIKSLTSLAQQRKQERLPSIQTSGNNSYNTDEASLDSESYSIDNDESEEDGIPYKYILIGIGIIITLIWFFKDS
ncbi:MAG: hypothetical protein IJK42_10775 [Prevotella sp.]|nr:hypothetical protein [Prevotella sp.]